MIFPKLKIFQRGLVLVGLPLLIELCVLSGLALLLWESDQEQLKENTYRKLAAINARLIILATETPYYLINSIAYQSDKLFKVFEEKQAALRMNQKMLLEIIAFTPEFSGGMKELQESIDKLANLNDALALNHNAHVPELLGKLASIVSSFNSQKSLVTERLAKMLRAGEELTAEMQKQQSLIRLRQSQILWSGLALNLLAAVLLARFYKSSISSRLQTIKQNTIELASGQEMSSPLAGSDEIAQLDTAFHDMDSELKLAAAREKQLFDNAADVICVIDENGRFLKVNQASMRLWCCPPETLIGSPLSQLILPADLAGFEETVKAGIKSAEPFSIECKLLTKDGKQFDSLWSSYWSRLDNSLYCVVHDVSKSKQIEAMKQHFLSMISSDLKRPLSSMSSSINTLLGSDSAELPRQALDKLKMAGTNLQRLLLLVSDLLQVAEMDTAGIEIKMDSCRIDEVLQRSSQEVEALADKRGIKIELAECGKLCFLDANRIVQVLVNLLSNAIKFSPEGGSVKLRAFENGRYIEIEVIDQGRGVPDSHKEAIFEKFKQVEAADGKRKSGTGLGLPICKQIVEEHQGEIGVESSEGKGSRFWFRIPKDDECSRQIKAEKDALAQAARRSEPKNSDRSLSKGEEQNKAGKLAARAKPSIFGSLKLGQKGALLVGLPLLFELMLVAAIMTVLQQSDFERKKELYHRKISFQTSKLMNMYFTMSLGATGKNSLGDWLIFESSYATAKKILNEIEALVRKDPALHKLVLLAQIEDEKFGQWVKEGQETIARFGLNQTTVRSSLGGKERMLPIAIRMVRRLEKVVDESEKSEFTSPEKQLALRSRQAQILILALTLNIAGSIGLAAFFAKDIVGRLHILADNAGRLAREERLNLPLEGSDEISELDRTFHATALALQESRQKERAVFDNSLEIICSLDRNGRFKSINAAASKLWGLSKAEILEMKLFDLIAAEERSKLEEILKEKSAGQKESQFAISKKDAEVMHMQWSFSQSSSDGEIACVGHDISKQVELSNLKKDFLAMVSHDLRTPLTAVLGVAKLAQIDAFGPMPEAAKEKLSRILTSGDQLLELINDLLDIEKLEAGKMQLILEEVKLRELIDKALATVRDKKRVRLKVDGAARDLSLSIDRDRMAQALSNLINHFLDHNPEKSSIELNLLSGTSSLLIQITDNSPPITNEEFQEAFDRLQSASSAAEERTASNGLSLPIAKSIIENHGGTISIDASKGKNMLIVELFFKAPVHV